MLYKYLLFKVITALILGLIWGLVVSRVKENAGTHRDRHVLEYGLAVKCLGFCIFLVGIFVVYTTGGASDDQRIIADYVGGGFFMFTAYLFIEFNFVRIEFDQQNIYTFSPWRKRRVIPWNSVTGYKYERENYWHALTTDKMGKIRLMSVLNGLASMRDEVTKRQILEAK